MEPAADLALMVFEHTEGAERAYSNASGAGDWSREAAFVEHHRHDRIVVRGTFAGHYVDADDDEEFIGPKTAEGALGGAAAGVLFGPLGLAVGLVGGGVAGGIAQEHSGPRLRSALFDELRNEVPEGFSAVILMAAPEHVDAMIAALEGHSGRLVRHRLTPDVAEALKAAVARAQAPPRGRRQHDAFPQDSRSITSASTSTHPGTAQAVSDHAPPGTCLVF